MGFMGLNDLPGNAEEKPAASQETFAYLKLSGSPGEIGFQIGKSWREKIALAMKRRKSWWDKLKAYADGAGRKNMDAMKGAAKEHTPRAVEELKGWAEGSGISYDDLFILNCNNEIEAYQEEEKRPPGDCSTVVLKEGSRLILAHNEDGNAAYDDLMFLADVSPSKSTRFIAVTYPISLPGNAPAFNEHGIVLLTNYIGTREVRAGIPRYFVDRMILESKTLEDAVSTARMKGRSYSFHHIIASLRDKKAFSVEVAPSKDEVHEISGLYLHTNHLLLPTMKDCPQFDKYVNLSSKPRLRSLQKSLGSISDISTITSAQIIDALSSHEGKPYSVCRHPEGEVEGSTLCTALFTVTGNADSDKLSMDLYRNNPCRKRHHVYNM